MVGDVGLGLVSVVKDESVLISRRRGEGVRVKSRTVHYHYYQLFLSVWAIEAGY